MSISPAFLRMAIKVSQNLKSVGILGHTPIAKIATSYASYLRPESADYSCW